VVSSTFSGPRLSRQIAEPGNLRRQSIVSRKILGAQSFLEIGEKSGHLARIRQADGNETDLLRKSLELLIHVETPSLIDWYSTTEEKDRLGREHLRMNFHVRTKTPALVLRLLF
jgi:hypothetical protein